ncbi:helix-turn-helix domain-containing GNAT family N-acetyltransferase [Mesorhizobium sp. CAU 1741]|uniref:helix-turn-helix domain-containing GNAT family N-acetyltransferase n=1 Tax=Mesorhizobium sp. CAU 1741 TaxID=3140366 RepID=UPI00325BD059
MQKTSIERVRSFNRLVSQRIGALNDSYLGRGRPLGQARLVFETGPDGCDVQGLRDRLGLDSGYMSRLLRTLAEDGLVSVDEDPSDRRRRILRLTEKGSAERAAYDRLSDDFACSILEPLREAHRERLVSAMAEVERLMNAAAVTIGIEPADSEAARACVDAYFAELDLRFEGGFDPGSGGYSSAEKTGAECFLLARLHGRAVGCGALKALDDATGEIKRMWIAPDMRGIGLSRRLLDALEAQALELGMTRVRLDTNRALAEAQALYRKAGYEPIPRYNDNSYADLWFEKTLDTGDQPGKSSPISR